MEEEKKSPKNKITVIGLGSSGLKVADRLSAMPESHYLQIIGMDTDIEALQKTSLKKKVPIDVEWRKGRGCGGDVIRGQRSFSRERNTIRQLIKESSMLIVTGGLGGGTVTGGAPIVLSEASAAGIPVFFVFSLPFIFEGHSKTRIAENGIKELLPVADVIVCLPNDLLFSSLPPHSPVEQSFELADIEIARAVLGIAEILRCGNLLSTDFSNFRSVMRKRKSTCGIGIGAASEKDGLHRCHMALEKMLDSPFFEGQSQIKSADALFISVAGGKDMEMAEMKKIMESIQAMARKKTKIITGINTDESYEKKIQITVLTVHFEDTEDSPGEEDVFETRQTETISQKSSPSPQTSSKAEYEQQELPLVQVSRGIFVNVSPTMYSGQDMDIPTFQRQNAVIDKGS